MIGLFLFFEFHSDTVVDVIPLNEMKSDIKNICYSITHKK